MTALWLEIPDPGVGWINANDRLHHHEKARRTAAWREATAWRAKQARLPHQTVRVRILAFVCLTTAHDFDAGNWHPTAKAAIDGLRDAGVLDEDSNAYVVGPDMRQGPRRKPRTLVLAITTNLSARGGVDDMTTETTKTLPPIPDVPYMHGIQSGDGMIHAVCRDNILWTLQDMTPTERHIHAFAACGAMVRVARDWGEFRRGTEWTDRYGEIRELCPYCCWEVALDLSTVEEELAAITPTGDELAALTRLIPDPLLAVNACRAVLASREKTSERDPDSSFWPQILAHLTAHRPMLLFPEACTDQCCHHDTKAECYAETAVACPVCSIRAGGWAGEWAGDFECTVTAPCSALLAAAEQYGKGVPE